MTATPTTGHEPTPPIANVEQAAAWNGPEGANWAEASDADADGVEDVLLPPLLDAARIGPDDRVLDIGCGTGALTRRAARLAHRGEAVGIDLSAGMLDVARQRTDVQALANARFEHGDAQVHPFPAGGFDVAVSHFGIMFFDDPVAAFVNLGRALRPGGRLAFVCPQAMELCDWYTAPLAAVLGRPPTRRTAPSRMFSLATPSDIHDALVPAGFTTIRATPLAAALHFGADVAGAARFFLGSGPIRAALERPGAPTEGQAHELLVDALRPYLGPGGVRIPGHHWLVSAARPTTDA